MQASIDSRPRTRWRRACLLGFASLLGGLLVAGCGGGSPGPTTTAAGGAVTTPSHKAGVGSTGASDTAPDALAFSKCMRASGVPSFPDPEPGGGFLFHASPDAASSPAFKAAQTKCQKLLPGGGPPGPGTQTHPSAKKLVHMVRVSLCMRRHGVPEFPDPRTSIPSNLAGITEISNIEEVIFLFPEIIDQQSPAFMQAAAACGFPLHNH